MYPQKRIFFQLGSHNLNYVLEAHSSCELFKVLLESSPNYGFVSHGRWDNFETP